MIVSTRIRLEYLFYFARGHKEKIDFSFIAEFAAHREISPKQDSILNSSSNECIGIYCDAALSLEIFDLKIQPRLCNARIKFFKLGPCHFILQISKTDFYYSDF